MNSESQTLEFEQTVKASPAQLYRAFTNATALREWLADVATTSPKVGGRCYLAWNDGYYSSGEFTRLAENEAIDFTWHGRGEPDPSTVKVTLTPVTEGTRVNVEHGPFGTGAEWSETAEALEKGWRYALENLASVMATGEDLRFTRRPMLGIVLSDFNADTATRLGVPVTQGIRLDSVVAGMGAEAAGLQQDDVIVAMAGHDVVDWSSLTNALQAHQAGDTVEVVFYRGPEKRSVPMTLSGRPLPEIPATATALAEAVQERYAQVESDLEQFFAEVSVAEARHKPAPDEWSAKEVLAHLIHSERGWHNGMADMIGGHEPWYDDWSGNIQARVAATVAAYPTVKELLDELKRHHAETVAMVANLPRDFLDRKATYWRLAYNLLDEPYHHETHMEQMRAAVAGARQ
ncbi:MAG TPA: SRPBCC domain-containing protein [Anaerolineae bacterium]